MILDSYNIAEGAVIAINQEIAEPRATRVKRAWQWLWDANGWQTQWIEDSAAGSGVLTAVGGTGGGVACSKNFKQLLLNVNSNLPNGGRVTTSKITRPTIGPITRPPKKVKG